MSSCCTWNYQKRRKPRKIRPCLIKVGINSAFIQRRRKKIKIFFIKILKLKTKSRKKSRNHYSIRPKWDSLSQKHKHTYLITVIILIICKQPWENCIHTIIKYCDVIFQNKMELISIFFAQPFVLFNFSNVKPKKREKKNT